MSKQVVSIRLDTALIERLDVLAENLGVTRTHVIERLVEDNIGQEERLHSLMQNPVVRESLIAALSSETVVRIVGKLTGEFETDEEVQRVTREAKGKLRGVAKAQAEREAKRKGKGVR